MGRFLEGSKRNSLIEAQFLRAEIEKKVISSKESTSTKVENETDQNSADTTVVAVLAKE